MEFSRQEYWSGLPFPSPGHFPNLEIEPWSPALQAIFFFFFFFFYCLSHLGSPSRKERKLKKKNCLPTEAVTGMRLEVLQANGKSVKFN